MRPEVVPSEIEVKLEAPSAAELRHIAALRQVGPYRLRRRRAQRLYTQYLDTREFALARAGVALRVRRHGRRWEATAKWPGRSDGSLHARPELTVALPGEPSTPFALPEGPLRLQLAPYVLGRPLAPILVTEVERRLCDVLPASAGRAAVLAEVALDTVTQRAPDGGAVGAFYHEVEIELRRGRTHDLTALGGLLQQRFGLIPSRATKFVRGLAAVYGAAAPAFDPALAVHAGDSVAVAAGTIVAQQLARLRACDPGTRVGRDPEALHDMRVAVRRLRAAMRIFAAALPARLHATLTRELGWLGQELGAVRDLDVQLANLAWHRQRVAGETRPHLDAFRRHLERRRAERRAALLAALDSRRYAQLLLLLERFALSAPRAARAGATEVIARKGRRAIKKAMRRLLARGRVIGELPEADDLHALRIRAKRLRYLLEALQSITGRPGRLLAKQLVRLQDELGRFNDAMVAAASIRQYRDGAGARAAPEVRQTLTALADAELRRAGTAQAEFQRAWKRFAGKTARRRCRALLRVLKASAAAAPSATSRRGGSPHAAVRRETT